MTLSDLALGLSIAAWLGSFLVSLVVPSVQLDPTVNLSLMAIVGGAAAFRQRKEDRSA